MTNQQAIMVLRNLCGEISVPINRKGIHHGFEIVEAILMTIELLEKTPDTLTKESETIE